MELLTLIGRRPEVRPADIDETPLPGEHPADYVMRLAEHKATISCRVGEVVLGADTTVAAFGEDGWEILGKPVDADDAKRMLTLLSGKSHKVFTGHIVTGIGPSGPRSAGALGTTTVTFRHLVTEEIDAYIATGEPFDRAGSYAIQGGAAPFVSNIEGSKSNVVGLDVDIAQLLLDIVSPLVTVNT